MTLRTFLSLMTGSTSTFLVSSVCVCVCVCVCVFESVYLNFGYKKCITDVINEQIQHSVLHNSLFGFSLCEFVPLCRWGKLI